MEAIKQHTLLSIDFGTTQILYEIELHYTDGIVCIWYMTGPIGRDSFPQILTINTPEQRPGVTRLGRFMSVQNLVLCNTWIVVMLYEMSCKMDRVIMAPSCITLIAVACSVSIIQASWNFMIWAYQQVISRYKILKYLSYGSFIHVIWWELTGKSLHRASNKFY